METFLGAVGFALAIFIVFQLKDMLTEISANRVKVAEANARAEEAKLEQKKLDRDSRTPA